MINNILNLGVQGVQQGIAGMDQAARKISSATVQSEAGNPTGDPGSASMAESLVELRLYERNVQASSEIVKTANELTGTLLDEFA